MSQKARKKKGKIIALILVCVILAGIGVGAFLQANNLKALQLFGYSQEERQRLQDQNQKIIDGILNSLTVGSLRLLTKEQEDMFHRGELTDEDALEIMMEDSKEENKKLQELFARIYLLRATFTGRLDNLVVQAKNDYIAQKKKGKVDKVALANQYIARGLALESECDGQMEAILAEIKAELERTDGDVSVISEIRATYRSEKSIKKANLLAQYL